MTRSARRFVAPLTFEAITRRPVVTDQWTPGANADIEHIAIASGIDLLLVAPATANTLGKFAHGIADDFLSSLYLATTAPVVLAPAMNTNMFAHPAVVGTSRSSRAWRALRRAGRGLPGVRLDRQGTPGRAGGGGRLRPAAADAGLRDALRPAGPSWSRPDRPTRTSIPCASSAIGPAAGWASPWRPRRMRRGARVTLVTGPAQLTRRRRPSGPREERRGHAPGGDGTRRRPGRGRSWPPRWPTTRCEPAAQKIAKSDGPLVLTLSRTRDILADLGALPSRRDGRPVLVGFAAETHDVIDHARGKLRRRGADLIVANDVSRPDAGFEVDTNAVTIVSATGPRRCRCSPRRSRRPHSRRVEQLLLAAPGGECPCRQP